MGLRAETHVDAQNQVLAIMKYQFFWKQAYRGTGSQKDSSGGGNGFNTKRDTAVPSAEVASSQLDGKLGFR
jgi:hypothetical protein